MPIEITVPRLGWSMEEGTFSAWLKQSGEKVQVGDPLFAVESDKVTMDVEALDAGILSLPPEAPEPGAIVRVGQVIGYLLVADEEARGAAPVTPRARRVAAELGVDPSALRGTGKGGRIRERDVREAEPRHPVEVAAAIPVTAMRRSIAHGLMESRQNTAPVTLICRADASRLSALRNRWKLSSNQAPAPSYTDIVAKLVAIALAQHPQLGGKWEADRIVVPAAIHIGIAVDTEHGLLVPVVRDVAHLSLPDLARRSSELIEAARARRTKAEDLQGGVFTITNLGAFGIEAFTPIINYPETAVLGLGAIRWEAVVLPNGQLAAREQITLSLTFDHRVVDGAPAARFLQMVTGLIEEPPAAVHCP